MRSLFLENQINKHIDVNSSIIVFGGGQTENKIFNKNEFKNVSFLNIDDIDLSNVKYKNVIASINERKIYKLVSSYKPNVDHKITYEIATT
tara:strand:+ start:429 stop:701 length:273 start_codon:yes stop_codon:yes gene_type:complete